MYSWLRGVTFGVVISMVFGAVALLQAGGQDRIGQLEQEVRQLARRVETLEKCLVLEAPRTPYAGVGKAVAMRNVAEFGKKLVLVNGTNWAIAQADQGMVRRWRATDSILIETSRSRDYPYALINQRTEEVAEAQYLGSFKL